MERLILCGGGHVSLELAYVACGRLEGFYEGHLKIWDYAAGKLLVEEAGGIVLADDSGLVVDALGGEPGVYSARYMGEDTSYEIKNREIIRRLEAVSGQDRSARFVCIIAAVLPDGTVRKTEGTMDGVIAMEPAGEEGFGYDPILYIPEYGKTGAQLTMEEKNAISHRGKALRAMKGELARWLGKDEK